MTEALAGVAPGVPLLIHATAVVVSAVIRATRRLLADFWRRNRMDAAVLRSAIEAACCATNTAGVWSWLVLLAAAGSFVPPMRLVQAVLFLTDVTPQPDAREDRLSRGRRIVERLGPDVAEDIVLGASRVMVVAQEAA